jgi:hypothetical protein
MRPDRVGMASVRPNPAPREDLFFNVNKAETRIQYEFDLLKKWNSTLGFNDFIHVEYMLPKVWTLSLGEFKKYSKQLQLHAQNCTQLDDDLNSVSM